MGMSGDVCWQLSKHFISPDTRLNVRGRQNISLIPTLVQELLKFFVGGGEGAKGPFRWNWVKEFVYNIVAVELRTRSAPRCYQKEDLHNLRKSENFLCTRKQEKEHQMIAKTKVSVTSNYR